MFNSVYKGRLEDDGFIIKKSEDTQNNPFEEMTMNQRLIDVKKNFKIHTVPETPNLL